MASSEQATLSRLATGLSEHLDQSIIWQLCFFTPSGSTVATLAGSTDTGSWAATLANIWL